MFLIMVSENLNFYANHLILAGIKFKWEKKVLLNVKNNIFDALSKLAEQQNQQKYT